MNENIQTFREIAHSTGPHRIDRENGVIYRVKVLGRESRNGRIYSSEALRQAAKLYDGVPVNLDHAESRDRSITEGFGQLRNPIVTDDGVYADLHYVKSHPHAAQIAEMAERMPNTFGLSHDARGRLGTQSGADMPVVESIESVTSVDIVRQPATVAGLFESLNQANERKQAVKLRDALRKSARATVRELVELKEMEPVIAAAPPVEIAADASPEETAQASLETLILAVLRNDDFDTPTKVAKIRKILAAFDGVKAEVTDQAPPGASEDTGTSAPASESVTSGARGTPELLESVRRLEWRLTVRDLVESAGFAWQDLAVERREMLLQQSDESAVKTILESWPKPDAAAGPRPAIKPASGGAGESYAALKEEMARLRKSKRRMRV